jgi:hypothetical protein
VLPRFIAQVRPWLWNCLQFGGPQISLARHASVVPLVSRLLHSNSGMAILERDSSATEASKAESQRLIGRYGRVPW